MAEALLRRDLAARGVEATVASAGLLRPGMVPTDEVLEVMAERGLDVSGHRSRTISAEVLAPVDIVIGMAREHVREVVLLQPALFARTYTIKELVWRGREIGPRLPSETVVGWLGRMGIDRRPSDMLGSADHDDVADPIGHRLPVFKKTATELESLVADFVSLAWPDQAGH